MHAKISYDKGANIYSLLGRYVGSMEPAFDVTTGARSGEKVDGYFVMDANLRHNKLFGNAYFNLKISNLFDEEIRYPNNLELNELLDKGTIGADRTIIGTLGWEFQ